MVGMMCTVTELLATKRTAAIGEQPGVLIQWAPTSTRALTLWLSEVAHV